MYILADISGTEEKTSDWIGVREGRTIVIQASGLLGADVIQVHQQFRATTTQVFVDGEAKELTATNTLTAIHGPMWIKLVKGVTADVEVGMHEITSGPPVL